MARDSNQRPGRSSSRWEARPVAGALVRFVSFAIPIAVSLGVAWALTSVLPVPTTWQTRVLTVVGVLAASTAAMMGTEVYARRLLPLSALLRMSMAFPEAAPSRYRIARSAGRVRDIEARVHEARRNGVSDEPTRAAEQLLELVSALSKHDRATRGHAERTRVFVDMVAEEMELPQEDRDRLRWAALLHDIGKLEVPAKVLNKPGKPDEDEWDLLRAHPTTGSHLAAPLMPFLGEWGATIADHHERFDGAGYPAGRRGTDISLGGRIVAVADAFEVMTAARSYKEPKSAAEAREELARCAGSHFDPAVVRAFLALGVGRLRWTIGPISWLAQSPILLHVGSRAAELATTAARVTTATAVGVSGIAAAEATDHRHHEPRFTAAVATEDAPGAAGEAGNGAEQRSESADAALLRAVERHAEQEARKAEREAAKAEEKAARDAEKAAREEARDEEKAARDAARDEEKAARDPEKAAADAARDEEKAAADAARAEEKAAADAARDEEKAAADAARAQERATANADRGEKASDQRGGKKDR